MEIEKLKESYYLGDLTQAELISKLDVNPDTLCLNKKGAYSMLGKQLFEDGSCEHCGDRLSSDFVPKGSKLYEGELLFDIRYQDYNCIDVKDHDDLRKIKNDHKQIGTALLTKEGYKVKLPACEACGHVPTKYCTCEKCKLLRASKMEASLTFTVENYLSQGSTKSNHFSCEQLLDAIYMASLHSSTESRSLNELSDFMDSLERKQLAINIGACPPDKQFRTSVKSLTTLDHMHIESSINFTKKVQGLDQSAAISEIKKEAMTRLFDLDRHKEIRRLWLTLALEDALKMLKHYCLTFKLYYGPREKEIQVLSESLITYGLSKTMRHVLNSMVWANKNGERSGKSNSMIVSTMYESLQFRVNNYRDKIEEIKPFERWDTLIHSKSRSMLFGYYFLALHDLDYFSSPVLIEEIRQAS